MENTEAKPQGFARAAGWAIFLVCLGLALFVGILYQDGTSSSVPSSSDGIIIR